MDSQEKIMSEADTDFMSEKFSEFQRNLKIHFAVSSLYNH